MAAPTVDVLSPAPSPADSGDVFDAKAFQFTSELSPFGQQIQAVGEYVETQAAGVDDTIDQAVADATQEANDAASAAAASESNAAGSESAALGYRNEAEVFRNETENARDAAIALVNFAGKWEDLTGALNTPATVFHLGSYWNLLTDLADVTASEPANDNADWLFVYTNAELRRSLLEEATLYADFENGDYRLYEGIGSGVVRNKAFGDVFDFTRGSDANGYGVSTLETVTTDVARFVYSPEIRKSQGLQIEESRTRLNTVAAAPTVAEDVTVTAVAHTISFYGTGEVVLSGTATETLTGTGDDERVELTFTPTAGTLTLTPSGDVVDLQLEAGSFATSVIRGEGSAQTRASDNCSRTLGAEFNPSEFTLLFSGRVDQFGQLLGVGSGTNSSTTIFTAGVSGEPTIRARVGLGFFNLGGFVLGDNVAAAISVNTKTRLVTIASSYGEVESLVFTQANIDAVNPVNLYLGTLGGNFPIPTLLTSLAATIPRELSPAELIALTQPEAQ